MKRKSDQIENKLIKDFGSHQKIVIFGEGCIGKTTLLNKIQYYNDPDYRFSKEYLATDRFDFDRIRLNTNIGSTIVDMWDTPGQESYDYIRDAHLKGADGIMLLYDLTNKKSIINITKWLKQIRNIVPNVPIAIIGNKADKVDDFEQIDIVKLRDCNLKSEINHNNFSKFIISIKEDTHLVYNKVGWFSTQTIKEHRGCLVGLEYLLTKIYNIDIKIIQ
jgi:small GTP-binding protein